jgi:hypothetical protein
MPQGTVQQGGNGYVIDPGTNQPTGQQITISTGQVVEYLTQDGTINGDGSISIRVGARIGMIGGSYDGKIVETGKVITITSPS